MRVAALLVAIGALTACRGEKTYSVPSAGMEPTIHCARPDPGCRGEEKDVIVVKTSGLESFERGDIVVHRAPPAAAEACGVDAGPFVKRVIGLPRERIKIARTETEVDGEPLAEPYATRDQVTTARDWIVPAGAYFLVGDNRPASCDSRHYGAVPADAITGKVVAIERASEKIELD